MRAYLTCSRAFVPFVPAFLRTFASYVPFFFDVPYVSSIFDAPSLSYLPTFSVCAFAFLAYLHILHFFTWIQFLRVLHAFIFNDLHFLRTFFFLRAYTLFTRFRFSYIPSCFSRVFMFVKCFKFFAYLPCLHFFTCLTLLQFLFSNAK